LYIDIGRLVLEDTENMEETIKDESDYLEGFNALRKELVEEKEKADKYLANWQRNQAEFDNFKKWVVEDKKNTIQFANSSLIKELLPVFDDMIMALNTEPQKSNYADWVKGVRLIYHKLVASLETKGVTEIEAEGKAFDPKEHEAVMCREGPEGIVIEVIRKGYLLNNKVLRPSLVIVGEGQEKKEEQYE